MDYNYTENEEFNISNLVIAELKLKKENKLNIPPTRMIAMRHGKNKHIIPMQRQKMNISRIEGLNLKF